MKEFLPLTINTKTVFLLKAAEATKKAYIITAYQPSLEIFEPDFITRKKK
ncbi:MAG: hypothetical protein MUF71_18345 [Candidatus Kapabacteria bacterium]|jgi:hypothetical protein|nr:hypothetical protein [Candidatus Kapabacteria bacterium]